MAREAMEAAEGARRQIASAPFVELGRRLRARPPHLVVTCARGSSDHAATYGKYLIETHTEALVASVGPSVASAYARAPAGLDGALFVAVSQSGRSPDLLELTEAARKRGALVLALVNDTASPLAQLGDLVIPLCAGEEKSVAATKSFLLAGVAFLQLIDAWVGTGDAVARVADAFEAAYAADWWPALEPLARARSLYVIGRGLGLGAAGELALKLKETCGLHAEAFSAAEVMHGPVALVERGFPIVPVIQDDETAPGVRDVVAQLAALGADVREPPAQQVPAVLAPLCHALAFYLAVPRLAAARGLDADAPRHLHKVTKTF